MIDIDKNVKFYEFRHESYGTDTQRSYTYAEYSCYL